MEVEKLLKINACKHYDDNEYVLETTNNDGYNGELILVKSNEDLENYN